jgi:hypothetical protein
MTRFGYELPDLFGSRPAGDAGTDQVLLLTGTSEAVRIGCSPKPGSVIDELARIRTKTTIIG